MDFLEHVAKDLGKGKTVNIVLGIIVMVLGIAAYFIPFENDENGYYSMGISAALILFGISFFFAARKKNPRNNPLYKALTETPERIKRVYPRKNIINGVHNSTVLDFIFDNGGLETIQIPKHTENEYLAEVKKLLPDAEYGYVDVLKKTSEGPGPE